MVFEGSEKRGQTSMPGLSMHTVLEGLTGIQAGWRVNDGCTVLLTPSSMVKGGSGSDG